MATYSVYKLKIDDSLYFTPGPTAGYVLAIAADGSTYWTYASKNVGDASSVRFVNGGSYSINSNSQQVAYDMFIPNGEALYINAGTTSFNFGSQSINNDGQLDVKQTLWIDGVLQVEGVLISGNQIQATSSNNVGGGGLQTKNFYLTASDFTFDGLFASASIQFATPFPDNGYSIITSWTFGTSSVGDPPYIIVNNPPRWLSNSISGSANIHFLNKTAAGFDVLWNTDFTDYPNFEAYITATKLGEG